MNFQNISDDDGTILVKMARTVVTKYLTNNTKIFDHDFKEKFSFNAGVFVTINDKSGLRGCIGFPFAIKKLSDALTDAAISASTEDPRFPSITQNEYLSAKGISIALSLREKLLIFFIVSSPPHIKRASHIFEILLVISL